MATQRRQGAKSGSAARTSKSSATKSLARVKTAKTPGVRPNRPPVKRGSPTPKAKGKAKVAPSAVLTGVPGKRPSPAQVSEAAKFVRVQKELLRIAELRVIGMAAKLKTSQAAIAALLGTSQPTVSRIAKQIEENPSILDASPSEIINRRAIGEISSTEMMKSLLGYAYVPGQYDPTSGDGFIRGDWRQIENALVAELITDEEYEKLAREAQKLVKRELVSR